jgi:glutathione synthase/RimK-type ligase-like ATP-grasp enzyme
VVERHILNGHSGAGIVIRENSLDIGVAPLYTEYVPKKAEYRVHFGGGGDVIDVQRKIRDPAREPTNWHVRSHDNGFIYVRDGVRENMPGDVIEQALLVARESGLEFGAIDVIYNQSRGEAYVLEVNTAPGLTGETVNSYANYFRQFL